MRAPLPVGRRVLGQLRPTLQGHAVGVHHASLAVLESTLHAVKVQIKSRKSRKTRFDLEEESRGIETSGGNNRFERAQRPGWKPRSMLFIISYQ